MSRSVDEPVVLVTGAGSGLGLESAVFLAERGWRVYGSVWQQCEAEALEETARSRNVSVRRLWLDVTRREQIDAAVGDILRESGRIDAVVQFAGMGLRGFFEDLTLEEVRAVYEVNVFGAMALTRAVLPHMRAARRGRLVFVSSVAGRIGSMTVSGYASSKFALEGFAECLAQEMAPFNIHVSVLEPGLVQTPHFGVNRNRAKAATDPQSPYYRWFCQHEHLADYFLQRNRFSPRDVATVVHTILRSKRPNLRYLVGFKAKLIVTLRRHIPGELFERIYFRAVRRLVTHPRSTSPRLS